MVFALLGCRHGFADPDREYGPAVEDGSEFPVEIHAPETLGVVDTPLRDINGKPIGVSCTTCHGPTPERSFVSEPGAPTEFHTGVELVHGSLTCNQCHDEGDRTRLRLADGRLLDMRAAMTLCAQCHGVQHRDYQRGSHGGMQGYWDRRRGPRMRNHCVDCHAPHDPAYKSVQPVFPPRDRFLEWGADTHGDGHSGSAHSDSSEAHGHDQHPSEEP